MSKVILTIRRDSSCWTVRKRESASVIYVNETLPFKGFLLYIYIIYICKGVKSFFLSLIDSSTIHCIAISVFSVILCCGVYRSSKKSQWNVLMNLDQNLQNALIKYYFSIYNLSICINPNRFIDSSATATSVIAFIIYLF